MSETVACEHSYFHPEEDDEDEDRASRGSPTGDDADDALSDVHPHVVAYKGIHLYLHLKTTTNLPVAVYLPKEKGVDPHRPVLSKERQSPPTLLRVPEFLPKERRSPPTLLQVPEFFLVIAQQFEIPNSIPLSLMMSFESL